MSSLVSDGKRFSEWRRFFGVSDGGGVFVPAAMAGDETEMNVMLCAFGDGQSTVVHLNHHFVPSDWLKRESPNTLNWSRWLKTVHKLLWLRPVRHSQRLAWIRITDWPQHDHAVDNLDAELVAHGKAQLFQDVWG